VRWAEAFPNTGCILFDGSEGAIENHFETFKFAREKEGAEGVAGLFGQGCLFAVTADLPIVRGVR